MTPLIVSACATFLAGPLGWWLHRRRTRSRIKSMWWELALRGEDHGPLELAEIVEVVDRWTT